jgi:protein-S-isoprenylcysteine O-methyltransferase Ste14
MTAAVAKWIFTLAVIASSVIRHPHQRRARKTPVRTTVRDLAERLLVASATIGLAIVPFVYVATGSPRGADHAFLPGLAWLGTALFALALWLFYRAHHDLGRNFSALLKVRDAHTLVTSGVYARIRHPMYTAFWLWAVAQALLLPNWVAGLAGFVGFGLLFWCRVGHEEQLMLDTFGDDYRAYMARTARIVPWLY